MIAPSHKRILRNTGMLYIRMLVVMAVSLYTSRVVLAVLGVEDFGIYHVVAGFVALLGFMQGAMTSATQRYFAFDLGESGGKDLSRIFSTSLLIHGLLALLIALIAETAGYWFVSSKLTIPPERMEAALWAYHLAIASFTVSVLTVPFTAMLVAHERMGVFAAIGTLDVLLKLAAVILLQHMAGDKLMAYASLLLIVSLVTLALYLVSNKLLFPYINLHWRVQKQSFRSMLSYTAWNVWGNLASALSGQGINVLLNIFFGPSINAGKSIAVQANGALTSFTNNLQVAINPQIIKLYASGERASMHAMVLRAARYNYSLLFLLALPVLLYAEPLLALWLTETPPYAVVFLQLAVATSLVNSVSSPLMTAAQATGRIKVYQTVVGGLLLLNVPISFLLLALGFPPESVLIVGLAISALALAARLAIISKLVRLPAWKFLVSVVGRSVLVSLVAGAGAAMLLPLESRSLSHLLQCLVGAGAVAFATIWLLGIEKAEKKQLVLMAKSFGARFV